MAIGGFGVIFGYLDIHGRSALLSSSPPSASAINNCKVSVQPSAAVVPGIAC